MKIRRLLPHRQKRLIGAWCFFDHAGPTNVSQNKGVRVGPHPHTGLQTFSWMVDGEILHRDSLGYEQLLRKGEVNLMTAGKGISHSEESPVPRSALLQLAQFWIALPTEKRFIEPDFQHYPKLPKINLPGATLTVLVGEILGQQSPVRVYTPLLGVDITTTNATKLQLPTLSQFEYGIAVLTGSATVNGEKLLPGTLLYLAPQQTELDLSIHEASQIILLGGEPFAEDIMLYWNFVERNKTEALESIRLWQETDHFGIVKGYEGPPLSAPRP